MLISHGRRKQRGRKKPWEVDDPPDEPVPMEGQPPDQLTRQNTPQQRPGYPELETPQMNRERPQLDAERQKRLRMLQYGGAAATVIGALADSPALAMGASSVTQGLARGHDQNRARHQQKLNAFFDELGTVQEQSREIRNERRLGEYEGDVAEFEDRRERRRDLTDDRRDHRQQGERDDRRHEQTIEEIQAREQAQLEADKDLHQYEAENPTVSEQTGRAREERLRNQGQGQEGGTQPYAGEFSDVTSAIRDRRETIERGERDVVRTVDGQPTIVEGVPLSPSEKRQMTQELQELERRQQKLLSTPGALESHIARLQESQGDAAAIDELEQLVQSEQIDDDRAHEILDRLGY